jgi:branched-chain amino acid transport system permease protein
VRSSPATKAIIAFLAFQVFGVVFFGAESFFQTEIIGFSNGLIFALVALGYTLVYGIIELINFAHGDVFMLGSMLAFLLIGPIFAVTGDTPILLKIGIILLVLGVTMIGTATLNVSIERVAYKPLRNAPKLAPLISAIGMSFVLQNVGLLLAGPGNKSIDNVFGTYNVLSAFGIDGITINVQQIFVAVVTIPLLVVLSWFVRTTRQGRAMRATAQDPDTAGLMGVDVNRTIAVTFLIAGALAGAAGVVQILYNNTTVWNLGFRFGLNSFTAAVLGGIGNLTGAVLGALIIGFIQAFNEGLTWFTPGSDWTRTIVFGILILILVFRPEGILGEQTPEGA